MGMGRGVKNPTEKELAEILGGLNKYRGVKLGLPMSVEQIFKDLASSSLFIGCDSGMAYVAITRRITTAMVSREEIESNLARFTGSEQF